MHLIIEKECTTYKDLISENIQIKSIKIVGKGGCFQQHFSKMIFFHQHGDLLFLLFFEFSIKFPAINVNIKKSIEFLKNPTRNRL